MLIGVMGPGLSGCDLFSPAACTARGCDSGLTLVLARPLPDTVTIEVRAAGEERIVIHCTVEEPCGPTILLKDYVPGAVEVTLRSAGGSTTSDFVPEYVDSYPNGPDCEPSPCRQGSIVVRMS